MASKKEGKNIPTRLFRTPVKTKSNDKKVLNFFRGKPFHLTRLKKKNLRFDEFPNFSNRDDIKAQSNKIHKSFTYALSCK
jgi:hypothetical protein